MANYEDVLSEDEIPPEIPYIISGEEANPEIPEADVVDAAGKQIGEGVNLVEALVGAEVMLPREDGKAQGIAKFSEPPLTKMASKSDPRANTLHSTQ